MSSVDVVVPCYNYGRYLETCVQSVLSQQGIDLRVLIIDDKSSDNTPEIGQALAERDGRVSFRRHDINQGHIKTFNEGVMDWAQADYVLLLSADDALTPGALARAAKVMDTHPDVGMTYGLALVIGNQTALTHNDSAEVFDYRILSGREYLKYTCDHGCGVPSPTAVVRTKLLHKIGGYHSKMFHTSDLEMWMRIATQASIGAIRTTQAYYRWHDANMTYGSMDYALKGLGERILTAEEVLQNWGHGVPGFEGWVQDMKRHLAAKACWLGGMASEREDHEGVRICTEFVKANNPMYWRTLSWWRFQLKSALRPKTARLVRRVIRGRGSSGSGAEAQLDAANTFKHGQMFGWWPGPAHPA